jgi:hypothetical protein
MNKVKKISVIIMAAIMAVTFLIPSHKAYAASGSMSITTPGEATIGQNITVTIAMSSAVPILAMQFNFNYNAELFDYVSAEGADVGTTSPSGTIPFRDESSGKNKYEIKVVLKPKAIGTANFSATDMVALGVENNKKTRIDLQSNSPTTQVMAEPETEDPTFSDATLSSLSIAETSLNEPFAKWTINYSCSVPYDVTVLHISAKSSQGGKTEVGGPYTNLAVGNNVITVKSYAKSGKVMTYTINVNRASAPAPAPETEPATEPETETETEPVKDTTVTIDGKEYVISKTFPEDEIPDGYTAGTLDISGDTIETVTNDVTGLNLVYLTDADENGAIYIYDKETKTFEKYIAFKSGKNVYVYLDASHASEKPEGMAETKCEIQGTEVKVYTPDKDSEFVYFYAVNSKGERIWYVYDTVEKTIQRSNNTSSQPAISDDNMQKELDSLKQDNDKLTESKASLIKGRNITFIAGGVVLAALIVLVVVLAAHKSEEKHSVVIPDEDDYDYDNEDDDSQSDNAQDEPDALLAAAEENTESESAEEEEQAATEEPVQDTDDETEAPETPSEPEVKEDDFDDVKDKVTQADMDAFVTEAQQVDDEPAQKPSEIKPLKNDEDGLEIETEIIDLGDDIFDDDEKPAAKEPEKEPEKAPEKEPEKTGEEPETIELEPSDGDDEEFFL